MRTNNSMPLLWVQINFLDEFLLISIVRTLTAILSILASHTCNTNATTLSWWTPTPATTHCFCWTGSDLWWSQSRWYQHSTIRELPQFTCIHDRLEFLWHLPSLPSWSPIIYSWWASYAPASIRLINLCKGPECIRIMHLVVFSQFITGGTSRNIISHHFWMPSYFVSCLGFMVAQI